MLTVEVVMDVVTGNGMEGELRSEPFPEGAAGAILDQLSLALQPAKISRSIWEIKDCSSVTLGLFREATGKPSILQKPRHTWPSALGWGRGSPKVESSRNRDGGRIIVGLMLLLLLLLYGGPAVGIGNGLCRADSIKGTAGGRGEQAGAGEGERKLSICRGTAGPLCCSLGGREVRRCSQGSQDLLARSGGS